MKTDYRKTVPLIAVGILVATLGLQVAADPGGHRLADELGLTEDQQASLAALKAGHKDQRTSWMGHRKEIQALIASGDVDAAADLAAQQARNRTYSIAERRTQLSEILTSEQLEQLDALRAEHGQRGGWGRRGRSRPR